MHDTPTPHEACWHFHAYNPQADHDEVCCRCGATRTVTIEVAVSQEHGPFLPRAEATKTVSYSAERLP